LLHPKIDPTRVAQALREALPAAERRARGLRPAWMARDQDDLRDRIQRNAAIAAREHGLHLG
jgi:hypothetical protein